MANRLNELLRSSYNPHSSSPGVPSSSPGVGVGVGVVGVAGEKAGAGNGERAVGGHSHSNQKRKRESGDEPSPAAPQRTPGQSVSKTREPRMPQALRELGGTFVRDAGATTLAQLGGLDLEASVLRQTVARPLRHPEIYAHLGVAPVRGVLLHGPPGCGKTQLARALAAECQVPFLPIAGPELVSGVSGESEAAVRALFAEAAKVAPCIVFLDEVDAVAPKRESAGREMERRIVAQLLTSLDELGRLPAPAPHVAVIAATNRPDAIDGALRRAGRFEREVAIGVPNARARQDILRSICEPMRISEDGVDFAAIAAKTPGFVGADLVALSREAAGLAVQRAFADVEGNEEEDTRSAVPLSKDELEAMPGVSEQDFLEAVKLVQPAVKREGFATVPGVKWEDVGALEEVKEAMRLAVTMPLQNPRRFKALGLEMAGGVLLFGPPGCGKTLVAKAVANESGANFLSIKGPELLNKYVGESERAVRQVFERARAAAPCVLFFDEMDAMAPRRGGDGGGSSAPERVVNQLLVEMDGVGGRNGVHVLAATNRPDMIDPALLRPGRLDRLLYVPLPSPDGRAAIAEATCRTLPLGEDANVQEVVRGSACEGFSGADVAAMVKEACLCALREQMNNEAHENKESDDAEPVPPLVCRSHFVAAAACIAPSVSAADKRRYDALARRLRQSRGAVAAAPEDGGVDGVSAP